MVKLKYKYAIGCLIQWYEVEMVEEYLQSVKNALKRIENKENVIVDLYFNMSTALEKIDKYYRLEIVNRRFLLKEIKKSEVETKIVKIIGKITLGKNKIQMNLADGTNMLSKVKFNLGDSAVLNTAKNTVEKVLPLKQKAKVEIISGKHAGEKGEVSEIIQLSREKVYKIKLEKGEVSLPFKTVLVIG